MELRNSQKIVGLSVSVRLIHLIAKNLSLVIFSIPLQDSVPEFLSSILFTWALTPCLPKPKST